MNYHHLLLALPGAVFFGHVIIAVLFLRFWRQTRERLFLWFGFAFLLLAIERLMLLAVPLEMIHNPKIYITRLIAFLLIAWAIWDRNRVRG